MAIFVRLPQPGPAQKDVSERGLTIRIVLVGKVGGVLWAANIGRPKSSSYFTCFQSMQVNMHLQISILEFLGEGIVIDLVVVHVANQDGEIVVSICIFEVSPAFQEDKTCPLPISGLLDRISFTLSATFFEWCRGAVGAAGPLEWRVANHAISSPRPTTIANKAPKVRKGEGAASEGLGSLSGSLSLSSSCSK